ncbi:RNA polymerase sigma-70 factor [Pseudoflavitalea sp. G-6-1-2]|uniref:RNA polymerase sigma factor n=1 Tax=Pseudoflavitalea sp. G-6-1-2 TaxID=2728841 RepID=UPI001469C24D|nr:RNA polymerase sigma-70 factor [Pseudoflavitalea sp. G-6-1-2]NML23051.1 RNA polymerase sigma-70 factor [Pseudoflavitalea sp. G-6-1-2]
MPPDPIHTEKELLSLIAAGDEYAFKALHSLYWNEVYSLAIAFTKSPSTAEDIVQEVFLKLWIKRHSLDHIANFRAYFMIMVRNELISALRKNKKQEKDLQVFIKTAAPADIQPHHSDIGAASELVKESLQQLPERQQQIFRMSREEGMDHNAIADELNLSKKTVSNTITIVLAHIRKQLHKYDLLIAVFAAMSIFIMP